VASDREAKSRAKSRLKRIHVTPKQWKAAAVAVGCALVILIGAGLYGLKPANGLQPVGQLGAIEAFGPKEVVAGSRSMSREWLVGDVGTATSTANAGSFIMFRNRKLETVVSGKTLTASVPNELFAHPGEAISTWSMRAILLRGERHRPADRFEPPK